MKILEKMIVWGITLLVFVLPLFFLPVTTDFYNFNKNFLLVLGVLGLWGIWGIREVLGKKIVFIHTPLDLPVLLFAGAVLASNLLAAPNKVESFLMPGGTGTVLALTLLYFLVTNHLGNLGRLTNLSLTASAVVLALTALYQFLGVGKTNALPEWLTAKTWTPAGGLLPLGTFLGIIGVVRIIGMIHQSADTAGGKQLESSLQFLTKTAILVIIFAGLGVTVYQLVTTNQPVLLPYWHGWAVALETFKNYPLLGVGPGQFLTAFTRYKPLAYNQTNLWAFQFVTSSNWYFQLLTEVGIIGLGAWGWIVWKVVRLGDKGEAAGLGEVRRLGENTPNLTSSPNKLPHLNLLTLPIIAIFLLLALLPVNFLLLSLLYLLLAEWAVSLPKAQRLKISLVALQEGLVAIQKTGLEKYYGEEEKKEKKQEEMGKIEILPWLVFVPTVVLILGSFYFLSRVYAAELDYKKSLDAAAANKGKETYDLQIAAITKNPFFDHYRISYSQTNLALANSIASNPNLTDQDRTTISRLIQQAIREAKTTVALNPLKVTNWENLALLYRSLIDFAQGADQWAIVSFAQAINLNPLDPRLRINLGGVYYSLKNYDQAIREFEGAVALKPDLANAHYNLSAALRETGQLQQAQQEMETTLSLLEVGSNDYQQAKNELEALKEGIKAKETPPGSGQTTSATGLEEITPPAPVEEKIQPPLELPKETGPEITPSPNPEAPPTLSPSPIPTVEPLP